MSDHETHEFETFKKAMTWLTQLSERLNAAQPGPTSGVVEELPRDVVVKQLVKQLDSVQAMTLEEAEQAQQRAARDFARLHPPRAPAPAAPRGHRRPKLGTSERHAAAIGQLWLAAAERLDYLDHES